ncbi:MAG: hypothetical protein CHKLHMKO_00724 [Candidatus Argoarchaeum ethanivorans]|uniref:Uncharacterized protein n=1 Tax=Candidatus Argoarchaeum ethanivorans TaxID=2608793 RepID=A0A811TF07_9EURY|nr:MAG: hypothetical protein CHKLHMKO_00724 [Candidatus Argoarchaeum ethanivorans]
MTCMLLVALIAAVCMASAGVGAAAIDAGHGRYGGRAVGAVWVVDDDGGAGVD